MAKVELQKWSWILGLMILSAFFGLLTALLVIVEWELVGSRPVTSGACPTLQQAVSEVHRFDLQVKRLGKHDIIPDKFEHPDTGLNPIPSQLEIRAGKFGMAAFASRDVKKGERFYETRNVLIPRSTFEWILSAQTDFEMMKSGQEPATFNSQKENITEAEWRQRVTAKRFSRENSVKRLLEKGWGSDEQFFTLCLGEDQFVNHAPMGAGANSLDGIALRDIQKGEEILEDYKLFDKVSWYHQLAKHHQVWLAD